MVESKRHLYIVALAYYPEYFRSLLEAIKCVSKAGGAEAVVLVLNNADLEESVDESIDSRVCCVRHDNTGAEFGGYQAGLDLVRQKCSEPFDLIILNDTVVTHSCLTKEHLKAFARAMANIRSNRVIGHVDSSCSLRIDDLETSKWVRSNIVGFDHVAIAALEYKIYQPRLNDYVGDSVDMFFTDHIGLSTRDKISSWLFSTDGLGWYGAAPLTKHNCAKMAAKARSILQEFHLAMRLKQNGTIFVEPKLNLVGRLSVKMQKIVRSLLRSEASDQRTVCYFGAPKLSGPKHSLAVPQEGRRDTLSNK